ncbi:ras-specific guanine nucleotide-releasing factor RalGPS2-like, partial [Sinocyclocheilus grahami]|uniref:ras-specific guanine nucleotide-releasing factor RalGPS2-like n=1 Tax=Sinocyclocheilus grahami TaxID=75366 RepID=UPI0007AD19F0
FVTVDQENISNLTSSLSCVCCSFIHKTNTTEFKSATFPNAGSRHLLDDSVLESHTPTRGQAESSTLSSGISLGSSEGSELSEEMSWPAFESSAESEELAVHLYPGAVTVQGVLRRKTVLKEGKKPTVAAWTKYWVALCGTQLYYYTAKSLKATERKHVSLSTLLQIPTHSSLTNHIVAYSGKKKTLTIFKKLKKRLGLFRTIKIDIFMTSLELELQVMFVAVQTVGNTERLLDSCVRIQKPPPSEVPPSSVLAREPRAARGFRYAN